jgi:hypothetical protein
MNNSIEDLIRNEESEYPVPDSNRTMVNITNELSKANKKKNLTKKKLWMRLLRNLWRSSKTQLARKYKIHSRNIKTSQIKNLRRHRNN